MTGAGRAGRALAAAGLWLAISTGTALAALDETPRIESVCVKSDFVLRPPKGHSLADLEPGKAVPLVPSRICKLERPACMLFGEEVPLSQCSGDD